jgi:hypothetical protein
LNPALLLGFVASFCFVARNRRAQPLGIPVVAEKGVKRTPEDEEKGEEALASARYAERPIRSVVECAPGICVEIKKVRVESKPVGKMRAQKKERFATLPQAPRRGNAMLDCSVSKGADKRARWIGLIFISLLRSVLDFSFPPVFSFPATWGLTSAKETRRVLVNPQRIHQHHVRPSPSLAEDMEQNRRHQHLELM